MNAQQIAALGSMLLQAEQSGLVIIGGVRALISIVHAQPSAAELDAIESAVVADATQRKSENDRMSGGK